MISKINMGLIFSIWAFLFTGFILLISQSIYSIIGFSLTSIGLLLRIIVMLMTSKKKSKYTISYIKIEDED